MHILYIYIIWKPISNLPTSQLAFIKWWSEHLNVFFRPHFLWFGYFYLGYETVAYACVSMLVPCSSVWLSVVVVKIHIKVLKAFNGALLRKDCLKWKSCSLEISCVWLIKRLLLNLICGWNKEGQWFEISDKMSLCLIKDWFMIR